MTKPLPAPTRSLPAKPNLLQLRKQAKQLLKSYKAGQTAAIQEVQRFEQSPNQEAFSLADAQRILARAYGFLQLGATETTCRWCERASVL